MKMVMVLTSFFVINFAQAQTIHMATAGWTVIADNEMECGWEVYDDYIAYLPAEALAIYFHENFDIHGTSYFAEFEEIIPGSGDPTTGYVPAEKVNGDITLQRNIEGKYVATMRLKKCIERVSNNAGTGKLRCKVSTEVCTEN